MTRPSGDFFAITLNPTCTRSVLPLWLAGLNIKRSRRRPRSRSAPADICWVEDMQQLLSIRPYLLIYATSLISRTGSFDVHDETNSETISRFCSLLRSCAGRASDKSGQSSAMDIVAIMQSIEAVIPQTFRRPNVSIFISTILYSESNPILAQYQNAASSIRAANP